ncbi:MAG: NAD+ synthase [Proteobacteria bacterium]|jgi:NAD+ synthetase|nr:NAD+ synthase [Pseudomonadota bacterium]
MKVALCQIDPTVGDFDGNAERIRAALREARARGAELAVFPEMAISGYPPHDLLERRGFVRDGERALQALAAETRGGTAAIVGCVRESARPTGKALENCAVLLADGAIAAQQAKALLPTYDVFDERRYFEPAAEIEPVSFGGVRLGLTVCEDLWGGPSSPVTRLYDRDPVAELVAKGAQLIVNIAASPFTLEKRDLRPRLAAETARRCGRPVLFVNQVGGNDDLVFDGASAAFGPDGALLARAAELAEDLVVVDLGAMTGDVREPLGGDEAAALEALTVGTRDYARKCGFCSAVLGLSGGIDSALVAVVAARALSASNVLGVSMPTRHSSQGSLDDAAALARNLGIGYEVVPIDGLYQAFCDGLEPLFEGRARDLTEENLQARVRGVVLMALSNKLGHLVLTTGNKSESATGYCTLYGDMAGGLAVLSDVPKTLVYAIAAHVNRAGQVIPAATISKPPSAELRDDQKDEDSLPPYPVLDAILREHVDLGRDAEEIIGAGYPAETVREVLRLVRASEHKRRQAPPGLKITSKTFGPGRRIPMAQRWRG